MPSFKKVGLISQIPVFPTQFTTEDVLKTAFDHLFAIRAKMEVLEAKMQGDAAGDILKEYDELAFEFERLGGYNTDFELNRVVNGLRIPEKQRAQLFSSLSGGEKTRVNLARLILENTDILLLDEPTNHLDMSATEWLEEFLQSYRGTVLVVSHDRSFLDNTITRAIEILEGKAEFYSGNYSYYVVEKQRRFEELLEKYEREQREAKRLRDAAAKLHAWGTGNEKLMKKSRAILTRAERVVQTDRPPRDKMMKAKFGQHDFRGDEALVIRGLTKSFGERKLIDVPELVVTSSERIAIIGDNGAGKTTLVKIIMKQEAADSGFARIGPAVKLAYLPQIVKFDHPNRSILDTLIYELDLSPQMARNRLGAFMFSGDDVYKHVGDLSGGEKSRLRLCMLMNNDINMLILDEPTNHLDLPSREWIESALSEYEETLIFISHDRYFINRFATRIWSIEDGVLDDFHGTFAQYRAFKSSSRASSADTASLASSAAGIDDKNSPPRPKSKRKPSEIQKDIRRLEREIEKIDHELEEIKGLKEEFCSDYVQIMALEVREQELEKLADELYAAWDELMGEASTHLS
jgi:ATPase subunit of ABC transporter with duplicated ATPase domains